MEELAAFRDPVKASEEARREDVKGGEGETRIDAVWRKIKSQFVVL